jgi:protein-tyrosine phosphatase
MTLIVFVCRGNTCRSPLAESLARQAAAGLPVSFASAGVRPSPVGGPASAGARAVAQRAGLDLSTHRARPADASWLAGAAHIIALETAVADDLRAALPAALHPRIALLLSFAPALRASDVPDPWGGSDADYDRAFALIRAGVDGLVMRLRTR